MVRFCPICGKADKKASFHGELCLKCAKARLKPFPRVEVKICTETNKVIDKAGKTKKISIEDEITRLLKIKETNPVYSKDLASVEYDTPYGRIKQEIEVAFVKSLSRERALARTQYFEAIIQLRGNEKKIEKYFKLLTRQIGRKSFIAKVEELKEGLDLYCGARQAAISALNEYSLPYLRTEKLAGEKEGKRIYRTTLLVRF